MIDNYEAPLPVLPALVREFLVAVVWVNFTYGDGTMSACKLYF